MFSMWVKSNLHLKYLILLEGRRISLSKLIFTSWIELDRLDFLHRIYVSFPIFRAEYEIEKVYRKRNLSEEDRVELIDLILRIRKWTVLAQLSGLFALLFIFVASIIGRYSKYY